MVEATRAPRRGLGRALELLSQAFAFFGGAVFTGLIAMSATSITLRAATGRPLQGDFEMVQYACAIGIAAWAGKTWEEVEQGGMKAHEAAGNKAQTIPAAEVDKMRKAVQPEIDKFLAELSRPGFDAKKAYADAQQMVAKYSK